MIVSHELDMLTELCTRIVVLQKGHVIFDGDPVEAVETLRASS